MSGDPRPVQVLPAPPYAIFGLTLATDFPFASHQAPGAGRPDVVFTRVARDSAPTLDAGWVPAFVSQSLSPDGMPNLRVYRRHGSDLLRFASGGDYYLGSDVIVCQAPASSPVWELEIHLLGTVLAYWLERAGIAALHASAVVVDGRAVAFLSSSGGGKTTLAASFVQAGYPLLTDDILPLSVTVNHCIAAAGYPTMRMWPAAADWFIGRHEHLAVVHPAIDKRRVPIGPGHFGSFCATPQTLARVYLPELHPAGTESDPVTIRPVPPSQALVALMRHAFRPRLVAALGWQPRRLERLTQLVERVPVQQLSYPRGFDQLPRVRDAILHDLARTP